MLRHPWESSVSLNPLDQDTTETVRGRIDYGEGVYRALCGALRTAARAQYLVTLRPVDDFMQLFYHHWLS
jgi:hypothetical protein